MGVKVLKVDRIWGKWGCYCNVTKAIFYLLEGDYRGKKGDCWKPLVEARECPARGRDESDGYVLQRAKEGSWQLVWDS